MLMLCSLPQTKKASARQKGFEGGGALGVPLVGKRKWASLLPAGRLFQTQVLSSAVASFFFCLLGHASSSSDSRKTAPRPHPTRTSGATATGVGVVPLGRPGEVGSAGKHLRLHGRGLVRVLGRSISIPYPFPTVLFPSAGSSFCSVVLCRAGQAYIVDVECRSWLTRGGHTSSHAIEARCEGWQRTRLTSPSPAPDGAPNLPARSFHRPPAPTSAALALAAPRCALPRAFPPNPTHPAACHWPL